MWHGWPPGQPPGTCGIALSRLAYHDLRPSFPLRCLVPSVCGSGRGEEISNSEGDEEEDAGRAERKGERRIEEGNMWANRGKKQSNFPAIKTVTRPNGGGGGARLSLSISTAGNRSCQIQITIDFGLKIFCKTTCMESELQCMQWHELKN